MSDEKTTQLPRAELIFQRGETTDEEGNVSGRPVIEIDEADEGELLVYLRANLPEDRSVNIMIPLDDLYEALAFLTKEPAPHECPDPDCAYAQEVASLHVQVSRLESRLDSTRGELERTRERLREAERERDEWKREDERIETRGGEE